MLTQILDTTQIDMEDPNIQRELNQDLRRIERLNHPTDSNAYRLIVTPSKSTYRPGLHRFIFKFQYGNMKEDKFIPNGEEILSQTEALPMI